MGTCGEKVDLCLYRCAVRLEAYAHGIKTQQFTHEASQRKPCDVHVPTSTEPNAQSQSFSSRVFFIYKPGKYEYGTGD